MISRIESTREITWRHKIYRVSCHIVLDEFQRNHKYIDTGIAIYTTMPESSYRWKAQGIYKINDLDAEGLSDYKEELERRNAHYFARLVSQNEESKKSIICFVEDGLAESLLDAIKENEKEIEQHIDCESDRYKAWKKRIKADAISDRAFWPIMVEAQEKVIMM